MSELIQHSNSIEWRFERQILRIEPWGENSLRVRLPAARRSMKPCRHCCPPPFVRQRLPPKRKA